MGGNRKKPFSGKQKKEQLKEKREKKRLLAEKGDEEEEFNPARDGQAKKLLKRDKKDAQQREHRLVNKLRTVFSEEDPTELRHRRIDAYRPISTLYNTEQVLENQQMQIEMGEERSIALPRRPKWHSGISPQQQKQREENAFKEWLDRLASFQPQHNNQSPDEEGKERKKQAATEEEKDASGSESESESNEDVDNTSESGSNASQEEHSEKESDIPTETQTSNKGKKIRDVPNETTASVVQKYFTSPVLSYYERNLEVWRQLWRVLERSDVICVVTDVRAPLFHVPKSLVEIVREYNKPLLIVLNKCDLVPDDVSDAWKQFLEGYFEGVKVMKYSTATVLQNEANKLLAEHQQKIQDNGDIVSTNRLQNIKTRVYNTESLGPLSQQIIKNCLVLAKQANSVVFDSLDENDENNLKSVLAKRNPQTASNEVKTGNSNIEEISTTKKPQQPLVKGGKARRNRNVDYDDEEEESKIEKMQRKQQFRADFKAHVGKKASKNASNDSNDDTDEDTPIQNSIKPKQKKQKNKQNMSVEGDLSPTPFKQQRVRQRQAGKFQQASDNESDDDLSDTELQEIVDTKILDEEDEEFSTKKRDFVMIGMIGHPNVGKSSLINGLVGRKIVSTSRTPGHTKHFQTIFINKHVVLCDCPGLVFPILGYSKPIQIIFGLYPTAQIREPYSAIRYVAERIPLADIYNLNPQDLKELYSDSDLSTHNLSPYNITELFALKRGYLNAKSGAPDTHRAGLEIIRDIIDGRVLLCFRPPRVLNTKNNQEN